MKNFLIIDGNSIMNRAFYGLNTNMTSSYMNIHTNAIYGFLNIYWMILSKVNPDFVAVTFDLKAPTFRHKMYPEYKGTRKGMPDELKEQMPVIKDILRAMNIKILELEGYEADDILGTVSSINTKNDIFTYILSGDKDTFQLISDKTSVVNPVTKFGKTEYTIYTPELLMEKQGIKPYQVKDIKSLMGDTSDNIPGVKGIGEKTAYNLIGKYTTLENIYDNIDTLDASAKVIEKLKNDKEMAFMSKTLATINLEVPINFDYSDCKFSDVNLKELYVLFKKLEFNKFMSKYDFESVKDTKIVDENEKQKNNKLNLNMPKLIEINSTSDFEKYAESFNEILNCNKVSYLLNIKNNKHFTTCVYAYDNNFIAFYLDKNDTCYLVNLDNININEENSISKYLKDFFASKDIKKLGYNIKQDIRYILGNLLQNVYNFSYDIMIAYYLLNKSSKNNYQLDYILDDLFDFEMLKQKDEPKQISFFDNVKEDISAISESIKTNVCYTTKGIFLSYDNIINSLKEENLTFLFENVEMPLVEVLASMEHTGMYIDKAKLDEFDSLITTSISDLEKEIYTLASEEFNINSTLQLGNILFEKLKLPAKKKTKTGYSTDKTVLEELSTYHPIINKILEYRTLAKLKSTYVDGLRKEIETDGRIHTTFMQALTTTGRLSSVEPNLQNIPIRMELGSKIRTFFVAPDDKLIVDADYSQIELRVLSHMSKDENMLKAFKENIDVHRLTASQVFKVPVDEVSDTLRSHAKAVNFGIVYGISEFGLSKNIGIGYKEAKEYITNYLDTYKGIDNFMKTTIEDATKNGYVTTMFGRKRYIPELNNKNKNVVQMGKRLAMNTPIQGTAADIIKLAMNKLYYSLKENNLKSKLIMQVHDELIVETEKSELEKVQAIMKDSMENATKLIIPLDIKINKGKSWYDAK